MSEESLEKSMQNMDISDSNGNQMAEIPIESNSSVASSYPSPRQHSNSPVIVLTNADYKRPSSIISGGKDAEGSEGSAAEDEGMLRNWKGTAFLTIHVIIGLLLGIGALVEFIWNAVGLFDRKIRPINEINPFVAFIFSAYNMAAITAALVIPVRVLFSSSSIYMKKYCYKENQFLFWASATELFSGLLCAGIHGYIQYSSSERHLTPYLAGSVFLLLHGLLNTRFYFELVNGGDEVGDSMMLPYKPEPSEDDESMVERDDISVGV